MHFFQFLKSCRVKDDKFQVFANAAGLKMGCIYKRKSINFFLSKIPSLTRLPKIPYRQDVYRVGFWCLPRTPMNLNQKKKSAGPPIFLSRDAEWWTEMSKNGDQIHRGAGCPGYWHPSYRDTRPPKSTDSRRERGPNGTFYAKKLPKVAMCRLDFRSTRNGTRNSARNSTGNWFSRTRVKSILAPVWLVGLVGLDRQDRPF